LVVSAVSAVVTSTLSFSSITSRRREGFYWSAVISTFALGTAVGDLTAESWHWGYLTSGLAFCALITLPVVAHRWMRLGEIAAFWSAYVLTRPLGASFADWMGGPTSRGGLGIETAVVAALWGLAIALVVGYLALTRNDALTSAKEPDGALAA
jgi:uncharacterized membrane-anchored protein